MGEKENLHAGHRKRMKEQLLSGMFSENTPPHILLEMLLYFSVPRQDTNPLAHRLLNQFGSIEAVLNAPTDELIKIKGVTENTVSLFKLYLLINQKTATDKLASVEELRTTEEIGRYLQERYRMRKRECVSLLCLRGDGKILSFDVIGEGDIASVGVSTRSILEKALKYDATVVVLAHNHPSGIALPSAVDIEVTRGLALSLKQVGIKLLDHIILAENDYVSMAESQEYNSIF